MVKHSFECHFTLYWGRFRNVVIALLSFCSNFPSAFRCFGVVDMLIYILHACIVNVNVLGLHACTVPLYACIVDIVGVHCTSLHCCCCFLLAQNSQLRDTLLTLWWTSTRTYRWPRTPFIWIVSKTGYMGKTLILLYSTKLFKKSCDFLQQGDDWRRPYRQWGGRRGGKILEVDVLQVGS